MKDYLRRNAMEERNMARLAQQEDAQREIDMNLIERMRREQLPIPKALKDKYGDDLTEMNFNLPRDAKKEQLSKVQRIRR
jgi:hypothetical protein